jgi:alpha-beta hydrolase superfamily lysophospholipase
MDARNADLVRGVVANILERFGVGNEHWSALDQAEEVIDLLYMAGFEVRRIDGPGCGL